MRPSLCLVGALVVAMLALVGPGTASADPSHNVNPLALTCPGGHTVVVSFSQSASHQAFVVSSDGSVNANSIFVITTFVFSNEDGTFVVYDTAPGLTAQKPVTCMGDLGDGAALTLTGFFTPRTS